MSDIVGADREWEEKTGEDLPLDPDYVTHLADQVDKDRQHTPSRNFRAPDEEWLPAKAKAAKRGETITDALRRFLREYGRTG